jgi:wobble nucleotide-excising tRNase
MFVKDVYVECDLKRYKLKFEGMKGLKTKIQPIKVEENEIKNMGFKVKDKENMEMGANISTYALVSGVEKRR